jgi:hypothetical protein
MSKVVIQGNASGTGNFTIAAPNSNTNRTLTLPDETGTVVSSGSTSVVTQTMLAANVVSNGPAFSAYQSTQQSTITANVSTLVQFQTEEFDTNGCFNNTGSTVTLNGVSAPQYSFAPNVAGYYRIGGGVSVASSVAYITVDMFKNGSVFKRVMNTNNSTVVSITGSALIYLNGTSDYAQLYCTQGANQQLVNSSTQTYFQAEMVRSV